jgi:hypothetical protein
MYADIMSKHVLATAIAAGAALVMTACSEAPKTETKAESEAKQEAAAPREPVLGKAAFYEMYKPARAWATDLLVLSLTSGEVEGFKIQGGKAAMWTAVFVSPSKQTARTFTYAIVDQLPKVHKGVFEGGTESWTGSTKQSEPFHMTDVAYNSDTAEEAAAEKAAAFLKKNPNKPLSFFLGKASRFPAPVWYVLWGDKKLGYSAFVDATSGKVMTDK